MLQWVSTWFPNQPTLCSFPPLSSHFSVFFQSDAAAHSLIMPIWVNLSVSTGGILCKQPQNSSQPYRFTLWRFTVLFRAIKDFKGSILLIVKLLWVPRNYSATFLRLLDKHYFFTYKIYIALWAYAVNRMRASYGGQILIRCYAGSMQLLLQMLHYS